jgi:UDP-N-acetylglucosamine 2-epimerase (non-hydrolysing)/GDP/UDP-N,N'-diacetylbacillosamine 2-epimerase (hydrolysing)
MPNVCVVTGSRAEYGLLRPVMQAIAASSRCQLRLIVAGLHLAHEFGDTGRDIEADGFHPDARVDMAFSGDSPAAMAKSIGIGIYGMAQAIESLQPEIVLVLGDRTEAFAAAVSGAAMNKLVAHIHGGEVTRGGLDESMRHAITKLAHLHFVATEASRERVVKLGERPEDVILSGAPGLDSILRQELLPEDELSRRLGIPLRRPRILLAQHPVSTRPDDAAREMSETLAALAELGHQTIAVYPNGDAGGRRALERLLEFGPAPWLHRFPNLDHTTFLSLLAGADVLAGNSSSGIIEAPALGVPVVNIGPRQQGRERSAGVLDAAHDRAAIRQALEKALHDESFREQARCSPSVYGDGQASRRIVSVLETVQITPERLQKQLAY